MSRYTTVEGDADLQDQYRIPTDEECDALFAWLDADDAERATHAEVR